MASYKLALLSLALLIPILPLSGAQSAGNLTLASYNVTLNIPANQTFPQNATSLNVSYFTSRYSVGVQYHIEPTAPNFTSGLTALNSTVDPSVLTQDHIIAVFYPDYGYPPFGGNLILSAFSDVKSGVYHIPLKAVGANPAVVTLVLTVRNPSNTSAPNSQILFNTTQQTQGSTSTTQQSPAQQQGSVSVGYLYAAIVAIIVLAAVIIIREARR